MPAVSLILGFVALLFMVGGMLTSMVPFLGSVLSFGAPVISLFGLVLGGVAMSRATRMGDSSGLATAGMVTSGIVFVFSLVFALTCGMCNACVSTAAMQNPNGPTQYTWQSPCGPQGCGQPSGPGYGGVGGYGGQGSSPNVPVSTTPPPMPPGPGVACERARTCCLAFAEGDDSFCDSSIASASQQGVNVDEACRQMAEGWASGLRAMGNEVPDECTIELATGPTMNVCTDHCATSHDGECDDGRPGSISGLCTLGSDCADCGPIDVPVPQATGVCSNSCAHAHDGECDDGRPGAHTDFCGSGTDCADCGPA